MLLFLSSSGLPAFPDSIPVYKNRILRRKAHADCLPLLHSRIYAIAACHKLCPVCKLQNKGVLNYILKGLGIIDKPLKILYSYPAIVVGMVYVLLPFMILSVYSSAEKLDWSLVEAARDLGAGKIKAFWTVSFKLTLPGLLSGVILTFIPSMGLFFIADILGGNKIVLVGSLIQEQMTRGNNWPFAAALAVVLMILTSLMIGLYRKITNVKELEGIG